MSRSFFPGRPRRERRVFVSSARNKPLSLDFLRPYRDGLDEFEKIVTKELGDEVGFLFKKYLLHIIKIFSIFSIQKPFEGFTRLEIRECTNRYLSCAQLEDEEFFPMNHRARKPIQGPISSTPKLKKGSKMPVRNLALHFEELTSVKEPTIELDEADHPTVPVKRGRGRPRKSNNDEGDDFQTNFLIVISLKSKFVLLIS